MDMVVPDHTEEKMLHFLLASGFHQKIYIFYHFLKKIYAGNYDSIYMC